MSRVFRITVLDNRGTERFFIESGRNADDATHKLDTKLQSDFFKASFNMGMHLETVEI